MDKPDTVRRACSLFWHEQISYEQLLRLLTELPGPPPPGPEPTNLDEFYQDAERTPDPNDGFWIAALRLASKITPEQELALYAASAQAL